jgi:hypothetical protein
MEPITFVAVLAGIVGIVAGLVQVIEYVQRRRSARRERKETAATIESPSTTSADLAPSTSRREIPHNLPHRGEFIGREREKAEVHEALASRFFLVSIDGIGGIGKTSLALEVVHECVKASAISKGNHIPTFDAIVWTTAKGRDLTLTDVASSLRNRATSTGLKNSYIVRNQFRGK